MKSDWRYINYTEWALDELLHSERDEDKIIDMLDGYCEKDTSSFDAYEALSCLNEKEAKIVELILFDGRTYISVGNELGLSKQRIHQIYNIALKKLKDSGVIYAKT